MGIRLLVFLNLKAKEIKNIAKGLNEGTPADGGYTVPEDISTLVEQRREAKASLIDLDALLLCKTAWPEGDGLF